MIRLLHAIFLALLFLLSTSAATAKVTDSHFHNDISGSPMLATDAAGNQVWKESYRPYGQKLRDEPASRDGKNKIGFAGSPFDASTGLSYMGARYYDPVIGRFMGVDPVGFQEGNVHSFNRYAYANNNPYKFIDPDGRIPLLAIAIFTLGAHEFAETGIPSLGGGAAKTALPKAALNSTNAAAAKAIATPYGLAAQSDSVAAVAMRTEVEAGATLYRIGTTGKSQAAEAQFWSLQHPLSANYASKYGLPAENVLNANFIEAAILKPGTPFITRTAPGIGANVGGGIEVVVPPGGVQMKWFTGTP